MMNGPAARGPTHALRKLHVEVTTRCNLACAMCLRHVWQEPEGDMAPETFGALAGESAQFGGAGAVQFGGFGEPLCHPGIIEFVGAATDAGLATEVVTNGTLLSRDLGLGLIEAGLGRLIISACGEGGLHPAAQTNIRSFRRATIGGGCRFPSLTLHAVMGRSNIKSLPRLRSIAMALGADEISLSHLLPHTEAMAREALYGGRLPAAGSSPGTPANPWQPHIALPAIEWDAEQSEAVGRLLAGQTNVTIGRTSIDFGNSVCPSIAEGRAAIGWRGDLAPCLSLLHTHPVVTRRRARTVKEWHVGNITQTPLPELWNRPDYLAFRDRVRDFSFPPCPNCGDCELVEANDQDCYANPSPTCGDCLYARGLVRCP